MPTDPRLTALLAPDIVRAVQNALVARAVAQDKRTRVDALGREILTERVFTSTLCTSADTDPEQAARCASQPPERITDPKALFGCQDEALCAWYYAEANRRARAAGLKPADLPDNHCPALVAEELQWQAEEAVIALAAPVFGLTSDQVRLTLNTRDRFLELVIRLLVNHPTTAAQFQSSHILARFQP